jgi:hypothetical protein
MTPLRTHRRGNAAGNDKITRARLLRDFVERRWARLTIREAVDVPEIR